MSKRLKPSKSLEYFALALTFFIGVLHVCAQSKLAGVVDTNYKNATIIIQLNEDEDCSVRAISEAYDITYLEAHSILESWGREYRTGVFFSQIEKGLNKDFPNTYRNLVVLGQNVNSHTFVRDIAIAGYTYLILADRHIFVIEQGQHCQWLVKGNMNDAKKPILGYIAIKNK